MNYLGIRNIIGKPSLEEQAVSCHVDLGLVWHRTHLPLLGSLDPRYLMVSAANIHLLGRPHLHQLSTGGGTYMFYNIVIQLYSIWDPIFVNIINWTTYRWWCI